MHPTARAPVLVPGLATGIGSLPHTDARVAAELVLRCLPDLPAAPQLPARDPREGMLAQWLGALPEVDVMRDGSIAVTAVSDSAPDCAFDDTSHAGLLAFLTVASSAPTPLPRLKVQITGPLTLGVGLVAAGMPPARAFRRAAEVTRAWSVCLEDLLRARVPQSPAVLFLDEPALVLWRRKEQPLD